MTRDIRATRDSLGLSTGGLAKLVGVGRRTAERWMAGTSDVPEPVWRLLDAHMLIGRAQDALSDLLVIPDREYDALVAELMAFRRGEDEAATCQPETPSGLAIGTAHITSAAYTTVTVVITDAVEIEMITNAQGPTPSAGFKRPT